MNAYGESETEGDEGKERGGEQGKMGEKGKYRKEDVRARGAMRSTRQSAGVACSGSLRWIVGGWHDHSLCGSVVSPAQGVRSCVE